MDLKCLMQILWQFFVNFSISWHFMLSRLVSEFCDQRCDWYYLTKRWWVWHSWYKNCDIFFAVFLISRHSIHPKWLMNIVYLRRFCVGKNQSITLPSIHGWPTCTVRIYVGYLKTLPFVHSWMHKMSFSLQRPLW